MDDMDMSAAVQATTAAKRALLSMLEQTGIRNCQLSFSLALGSFSALSGCLVAGAATNPFALQPASQQRG
jgi:hypothetical protein